MKLPSGQYACVQSPTEVQMDAVLASHTQHKARKHSSPPTHTHTLIHTHAGAHSFSIQLWPTSSRDQSHGIGVEVTQL